VTDRLIDTHTDHATPCVAISSGVAMGWAGWTKTRGPQSTGQERNSSEWQVIVMSIKLTASTFDFSSRSIDENLFIDKMR